MLEHGGRLRRAAADYRIPLADWLDLSTGVNPNGWPVPALPASAWSALPQDEDGLTEAARGYYGARHILAVAGSQAAIQTLPRLRPPGRVGVVAPGYAEHAHTWAQAGHEVVAVDPAAVGGAPLDRLDALVLIHPNNPTGQIYAVEQLLDWHARLAGHGGWLVVDEAFIDAAPAASLAGYSDRPGLVVLRSLGKFFGLAGARVGFVLAAEAMLAALQERLGPWAVSGPSREAARLALSDHAWQMAMRPQLIAAGERLAAVLNGHGLASTGAALFQSVHTGRAPVLHDALARRGILVRRFDAPAGLRFGLPGREADWQRLDRALAEVTA